MIAGRWRASCCSGRRSFDVHSSLSCVFGLDFPSTQRSLSGVPNRTREQQTLANLFCRTGRKAKRCHSAVACDSESLAIDPIVHQPQYEAQKSGRRNWLMQDAPLGHHARNGLHRRARHKSWRSRQYMYLIPANSGPCIPNRIRPSWHQIQQARRQKIARAKSSLTWRVITFAASKRGPAYLRSESSATIWRHVARGIRLWSAESDQIQRAIARGSVGSSAVHEKNLLQFKQFIPVRSGTVRQPGEIYRAWMSKSWRGKLRWWRHALYYSLLNSPLDALRIVNDISKRSHLQIPAKVIADALLLFDQKCVAEAVFVDSNYDVIIPFHETVCLYLDRYTKLGQSVRLPWIMIRRFSRVLDAARLRKFVDLIHSSRVQYNVYTKLHTMSRYLELNRLSYALDLFSTFTQSELENRAVHWFCVSVLRLPWQVEDLHAFRKLLIQHFLDKGLKPNSWLRNVILQVYLESGDRETAWAMLDTIRKLGLQTSEHTYAVFLKHTSLEDSNTINALYDMAREDKTLPAGPFLAGYFVQIAACGRLAVGENSFGALLALYETLFDTSDLQDFGLIGRSDGTMHVINSSSFALKWMVVSWIQENRDDAKKLVSAYSNYQFHLRNNHPRISLLANDTDIGTSFVFAFGRHKSYLHMCTKVLQDMMQPDKPMPIPSWEEDPKIPAYEKFLEPEDPNDIQIPLVETSTDVPAYEQFLEPEEPADAEGHPESTQGPDLAAEMEKVTTLIESERRTAYAYRVAPPGNRTWNALLAVLLQHGQTDAAENVIQAMLRLKIRPDQTTWQIFIQGVVDSHLQTNVNAAVEELRNNKPRPDVVNFDEKDAWKKSKMLKSFEANLQSRSGDLKFDEYNARTTKWSDIEEMEIEEKVASLDDWGTAAVLDSRY